MFGSRAHLEKAAAAQRSKLRNFLTWGFHLLVTLVAGGRIRDTQCGFKVLVHPVCGCLLLPMFAVEISEHPTHASRVGVQIFTRQAAAVIFGNQRLQRWCFDVELLFLAEQVQYNLLSFLTPTCPSALRHGVVSPLQFEVPVTEVSVHWTEMAGSKIRFTSILHMAFELLSIKVCAILAFASLNGLPTITTYFPLPLLQLSYQVLGIWRVYAARELQILGQKS